MEDKILALKSWTTELAMDMLSSLICIGLGIWLLMPRRNETTIQEQSA